MFSERSAKVCGDPCSVFYKPNLIFICEGQRRNESAAEEKLGINK